jgi:hypothetical protein
MSSDTLPGVASLREWMAAFRYSCFRLETLQSYPGDDDEDVAAFRAGIPQPRRAGAQWYYDNVAAAAQDGRVWQRVHVVTEPLTDYIRAELAGYSDNVRHGEDVRIIPVEVGESWPVDIPHYDFWMFDSAHLFDMLYDEHGVWLGAQLTRDTERIAENCYVRDAALHQSVPWADYIRADREVAEYLTSVGATA